MTNKILQFFSLKYKEKDFECEYQYQTKKYTSQIFNFFFIYLVIAMGISLMKNIIFYNPLFIFRSITILFFLILLVYFIKKSGERNKNHLEFGFCFTITFLYYIHLKYFFPPFFEILSSRHVYFLASGLDAFRVFLFIGNINWRMVWITNMILNYFHYSLIWKNETIEEINLFSFLFPFILSNTFPFVAYFIERNFRILFYQYVCFDLNLKSFEDLINKILPNHVIILDEYKKNILFCNEEAKKFHKTSNYSEIYKKIKNIYIMNTDLITILPKFDSHYKEHSFQNYQTLIIDGKTNEKYNFDIKVSQIHWQNEKAFLILMSDISARKMVKKLIELDAYKDELLSTVSHDLRTPVNGIVGILELLYEKIVDKELKKYVKIASKCSNLLLFMINDILDFSQINNGKLRLIPSKTKIIEMTKEVISCIKFQCQRKNIDLILDIASDLKNQSLFCDYRRVQQVLLNLISNSLKFTQEGFIKLSIQKIYENNKTYIQFSVKDTGIGIKKEDQKKLFQLFGKIDLENPTMNKSGTGLGLVISKRMVNLLSGDPAGDISVESEFKEGSTFRFKLPFDLPEEEDINEEFLEKDEMIFESLKSYVNDVRSQNNLVFLDGVSFGSNLQSPTIFSPQNRKKQNILLVDDDQINLFIIGKYLESFGLNYKTASDGKMALYLALREKNFTLILMDCYMPIMNGFESTEKIKDLIKSNLISKVQILGLTASTSAKDRDNCKNSGMDDFLTKPVSKKLMKEKLQQILNIKIYEKDKTNLLS